ncbi:hypothetical protein NDU88_004061 [Pleurodeles waltl]|uniref:Uncharacterized protein n=1 Tax=Pleurodeles waltl TaxID=8319 RepID=A0AAV7QBH4_PLEWA|nr:hypothetical protein NDU88_004061 [Pleurodeles waltl]
MKSTRRPREPLQAPSRARAYPRGSPATEAGRGGSGGGKMAPARSRKRGRRPLSRAGSDVAAQLRKTGGGRHLSTRAAEEPAAGRGERGPRGATFPYRPNTPIHPGDAAASVSP